jgi:hypothetical protein
VDCAPSGVHQVEVMVNKLVVFSGIIEFMTSSGRQTIKATCSVGKLRQLFQPFGGRSESHDSENTGSVSIGLDTYSKYSAMVPIACARPSASQGGASLLRKLATRKVEPMHPLRKNVDFNLANNSFSIVLSQT